MPRVKGYFIFQRKLLRWGGMSLEENENLFYKMYCLVIYILFIVYLYVLVNDVVTNFNDFDVMIDSTYHGIAIITILFKLSVISINSDKINKTLKMLEKGIFAPNPARGGPNEEVWIEECVTNMNRLIIAGWILTLLSLIIPISATMFNRISNNETELWNLPFGRFSAFNPTHSPNFELAWLFQGIMFPIGALVYLSSDFLIVGVYSHIALQIRMLCNSIKLMGTNSWERPANGALQEDIPSNISLINLAYKLKSNVLYHMAILDLAQIFEGILNLLVLGNYMTVLIALACMMYHGSLYSPLDPRSQKDATLVMAVLFQTFITSYFGNEVTLESKMVLRACYETRFIGTDISFQKGLSIIMSRSQKPITFTIGKFADLSLILFVAVVKASVSYYMVLRKMNMPD